MANERNEHTGAIGEPPPATMMRMIMGYWVSQSIGVVARLGVADRLASGPQSSDALAVALKVDAHALYRVLRGCASVGVFNEQPNRQFALTPLGETLRSGVAGSMRDFAAAETMPGHWLPWGRLMDAVKTGSRTTPAALGSEIFDHYAKSPEEAGHFNAAMGNLSALVASEVARVYPASAAKRIVDVGGAHGTLLKSMLDANPTAAGVLFDMPHVIETAKKLLEAAGIAQRCEAVAGDFFESVPGGDLFLLKAVLHDWNDAQCITLLKNCARSAAPGARLLIVEMVIPDDGSPTPAQLMDLNMLVMLPGRERTGREYGELLAAGGWKPGAIMPTHSPFQVVVAER